MRPVIRTKMSRYNWVNSLIALFLISLLAGCDVNINIGTDGATPTPPAPIAAASDTPIPAAPTSEPPTATPVPPTLTVEPPTPESSVPTAEPEPIRIQFAPGATSATQTGYVESQDHTVYVLRAMKDQMMTVKLVSSAADVVLEIWGEDGQPLLRHVTGQTFWTGHLHATQDYFIKVVSLGSAVDYTLTVTIPPPGDGPEPTRIQFASGATSATVSGYVESHGADVYVLRAMQDQTMTVELVSAAADVVLEIWGEDGQPLLRHVTGQTFWTGHLHATQDYFIKVVSFGSDVDYALTVTIPPP